ncbi:phosphate ABC transporter substrate-binding protein PstS [uncultured Jatrophihabitans sp.]|uniref:phosphate ABC transporter substrate-binding protein PstS n=1 Tax=uncultured Jatrophihabitans sp. TaxID=1610747 RepID=UPI0035CC8FC6
MKLTRAAVAAGILASTVALAACGSSGGGSGKSGSTAAGGSSASGSGSAGSGGTTACSSGTLNGEGSTAQTNAMTAWVNAYTKKCTSAKINYNPTGSGAGVSQFNAGQVNFAGSDSALDPTKGEVAAAAKACGSTALDLPMVVGPIAVAYKLKGVTSLTLTPSVLAKIFTGKITTWNDAAIKSLNSGANLPSTKISVVFRSDASGTTQNFEKYLAAAAPSDFTATPAKDNAATVFKGTGAAKSQGVAQAISTTEGAIGYDEYSFVATTLSTAKINNGGGAVAVNKQTASAAAGAAQVTGTGDDLTLKLDYATKTPGAYPIVLVTYEIVCSKYKTPATGTFVKNFLTYTANGGQSLLTGLGYAPLPSALQTKVNASIAKIS